MDSSESQRLSKLEARVSKLERILNLELEETQPKHHERETFHTPSISRGSDSWEKFLNWFKEDWLMKLGALLLLLALAWFVTYAFINNWIGPEGRIALGIAVGLAILVFGHLTVKKRNVPGQVLVATGATMVLLTLFAARTVYDFFTPESALLMMAGVIVMTAISATLHRSKTLAILALLGGAIAPNLTVAPEPEYGMLLTYIFLLDIGATVLVALRGWRDLILISLIVTWFYTNSVFPLLAGGDVRGAEWLFMALFGFLFFMSDLMVIVRTKLIKVTDLVIIGLSGILVLYWIIEYIPKDLQSILSGGIGILAAATAFFLHRKKEVFANSAYLHAAVALVFFGALTDFELSGTNLAIAYSLEVVAASAIAAYGFRNSKVTLVTSFLSLIPISLALYNESYQLEWWRGVPLSLEHFFVVLVNTLSLATLAFILKKNLPKEFVAMATVAAVASSLSGIAFLWLLLHNVIASETVARSVALVLYALIGVSSFFYGVRKKNKFCHIGGGVFLGGVVLRLLFIEVWEMPLSGKIVTFVLIGILLVSTAFFQKRLHSKERRA